LRSQGYIAAADAPNPEASSAPASTQTDGRDRRVADRFDLNDAVGSLIHNGTRIPCTMIDISLTGCCVRTPEPFTAGSLEAVKVAFPLFEMILNIWGITQWVRGERLLGIQFCHPSPRSKNQLAALLTCLIDNSAAEVVRQAVAEMVADRDEDAIIQLEHPLEQPSSRGPEPKPEPGPGAAGAASTPLTNTLLGRQASEGGQVKAEARL
jgi:hypothetical protein